MNTVKSQLDHEHITDHLDHIHKLDETIGRVPGIVGDLNQNLNGAK
jgi:hypothetical protein